MDDLALFDDDRFYLDTAAFEPERDPVERMTENLTAQQREAVLALDGPVLVLAGAGTGKTKVLTTRIAVRLVQGDIQPAHVLALTFTNKSGAEMRNRLAHLIGPKALKMDIGTFHAIFAKALRDCDGVVGLGRNFTIIDEKDGNQLIAQAMSAIGEEFKARCDKEFQVKDVVEAMGRYRMSRLPGQPPYVDSLGMNELPDLVATYDKIKADEKVVDYDDILFQFNEALDHPRLLKMFQSRWRMVLVDEYQDTNALQESILVKLVGNRNITCVGDDDQSIYSFRQADVRNILEFEGRWGGSTVLRLEENFRSTRNILEAANKLIAVNTHRHGKTLSATHAPGRPVGLTEHDTNYREADAVVERIVRQLADGASRSEIAVIARTASALQTIERPLIQRKIPYTLAAGRKISDRLETKTVAAYVRLALNPSDETAFLYALGERSTGVGPIGMAKIREAARESETTIEDIMRQMSKESNDAKGKYKRLRAFIEGVDDVRALIEVDTDPERLVRAIIASCGIRERIEEDLAKGLKAKTKDEQQKARTLAENRTNNLEEMVAEASRMEDVAELASNIVLSNERDEAAGDAVWLGTIHAAKGLEFRHVHLPAFEQGVLPSPRVDGGPETYAYQEERNLAYVAITRGKETVDISFAHERHQFGGVQKGGPSPFVKDFTG